ncbi:MAG: MipA/OmpV family protein [Sphingomicrobium sp.]
MRITVALGALAALIVPAWQAQAQAGESTLRIRPGLGVQIQPEYPGADKSELAPIPKFSIARGDQQFGFSAPDDSFGIGLVSSGGFSAGPSLAIQGSRKNKDVGAPLGKVKTTVEAGAFVEYQMSDSFRLRGELRKGLGGHDGLIGSVGADKIWRDGDRYVFSVGPRLLFSDSKYQRAYFGVTPQAALATGLPAYRPDGGLHGVAAASGLNYSLGGPWGVFGYARYERLVGDARKSPVVKELGSPNQLSAGLGVNYIFTMRK